MYVSSGEKVSIYKTTFITLKNNIYVYKILIYVNIYVYKTEPLCCPPETNRALQINQQKLKSSLM